MLISMDESEQKCWVTEVKNVLSKNDFDCVQLQKRVGDEKRFLSDLKQRLLDNFIQDLDTTIKNKDRYFPYRHVKSIFEPENTSQCTTIFIATVYFLEVEIVCFV